MANREISQFATLAAGSQSPTMYLPIVDTSLGHVAGANLKVTLNSLFFDLGLNTADGATGMTGLLAAPSAAAAGKLKWYYNNSTKQWLASIDTGSYYSVQRSIAAGLTAGRLPYVDTGGILNASANATLDSNGSLGCTFLNLTSSSAGLNTVLEINDSTATDRWEIKLGASQQLIFNDVVNNKDVLTLTPGATPVIQLVGTLRFLTDNTNTIGLVNSGRPSTAYIGTSVIIGRSSNTTGVLTFNNSTNTNQTSFQAGAAAASRTYTWPLDFGAAGSVLTDAAGNGTLSWTSAAGITGSIAANQVAYGSAANTIAGSANFTYDGTTLVTNGFKDTALTSGFLPYATTGGLLTNSPVRSDGTGVGIGAAATANVVLEVQNVTSSGSAIFALDGYVYATTASANTVTGTRFGAYIGASASTQTGATVGGDFFAINQGSVSATPLIGGRFGISLTSTGNVTNGYGIQVNSVAASGGGAFTGAAGIAIAATSGATNNTALLVGTTSIPAGNYYIYQSGNATGYGNSFSGNSAFGGGAVDANSIIYIGRNITDPAAAQYILQGARTIVLTGNNSQDGYQQYILTSTQNAAYNLTGTQIGTRSDFIWSNTGTTTALVNFKATVNQAQAGTITTWRGFSAEFSQNNASAVVTNFYNFYSDIPASIGTVTNRFGFYQPASAVAAGTNNVGIAIGAVTGATNNTHLLLGTTTVPAGTFGAYIVSSAATAIPLTLKGAASQSASLSQWVNSSGTVVHDINSGGMLTIGTASTALDRAIYVKSPGYDTSVTLYGLNVGPTIPSTATGAYYSNYVRTITAASAFTLANAYGFYVEFPSIGAGSAVTVSTAFYAGKQKVTGVTTGYGFYQADSADINYFAGILRLQTTSTIGVLSMGGASSAGAYFGVSTSSQAANDKLISVSMAGSITGTLYAADISMTATVNVLTRITNTENATATSNCELQLVTGGASGGDPFIHFNISGNTDWSIGADNSDSDKLVIAASTALGTSNALTITTAGLVTFAGSIVITGKQKNLTVSTGAGSAALGANSPAVTLTAPFEWINVTLSDGSTGYVPAWK